jgi:hypothetical protein
MNNATFKIAAMYTVIIILAYTAFMESVPLLQKKLGPIGRLVYVMSQDFEIERFATVISISEVSVSSRTSETAYSLTYSWSNEGEICESNFVDSKWANLSYSDIADLEIGSKIKIYTSKTGCHSILRLVDNSNVIVFHLIVYVLLLISIFGTAYWFNSD